MRIDFGHVVSSESLKFDVMKYLSNVRVDFISFMFLFIHIFVNLRLLELSNSLFLHPVVFATISSFLLSSYPLILTGSETE